MALKPPTRCSWWTIKADKQGDEQVLDRQISLWVDESPEQRKAIKQTIKRDAVNPKKATRSFGIYRVLWSYLPTIAVEIPYAENIGMSDQIDPRNFKLFLDLIRAHALMHAPIRETDEDGYILANRDDFGAARGLMNPLFRGEGGSQHLKLSMDEDRVLKFLATQNTGDITYGAIICGTGMPKGRLSAAMNGRSDKTHNAGLLKNMPRDRRYTFDRESRL